MKINITKIIAVVFCSIIFASGIYAQEKPKAELIGDFDYPEDISVFENLTEQLIYRLKQEPKTTTGLIGIMERGALAERAETILKQHPDLPNRIVFGFPYDKNYRRAERFVTFWIVPANAEKPDIGCRPYICVCPTLSVDGREPISGEKTLTFTANVSGGSGETVAYNWKVSAGEIVEGQGTPIIKVDPIGAKEITATVEIGGLECEECVHETSFTSKIEKKLKLIAVDGRVYNEQLLMHLDELLRELKSDLARQAYIINYGSRAGGRRDFVRRRWTITKYFNLINADTKRVTLMDGGDCEEETTELWISTDDTQKPTPTVDAKPAETNSAAKKAARRKSK